MPTTIIGVELSDDPVKNAEEIIKLSKACGCCIKNTVYSTVIGIVIKGVANNYSVQELFDDLDPVFAAYRELVLKSLEEAKHK